MTSNQFGVDDDKVLDAWKRHEDTVDAFQTSNTVVNGESSEVGHEGNVDSSPQKAAVSSSAATTAQHTPGIGRGDAVLDTWEQVKRERLISEEQGRAEQELVYDLNPHRKCLHKVFIAIQFLVILSAFLMAVGQVVQIVCRYAGPIEYVMSTYIILFCVLIILNELDLIYIIRESKLLSNWVTRGIFYSFVGVCGMEERRLAQIEDKGALLANLFLSVVSWIMIAVGILYFTMGVFCLNLVYRSFIEEFATRQQKAQERKLRAYRDYGCDYADYAIDFSECCPELCDPSSSQA